MAASANSSSSSILLLYPPPLSSSSSSSPALASNAILPAASNPLRFLRPERSTRSSRGSCPPWA
eukprot:3004781-Pyramimonas_sp.AAC.1